MLSHFLRASVNNTTIPSVNSDPYFNQTTLLLHGDGTNGAQNNTFIDSSSNNFTITRNGTPTQGTFTPFSQNGGYWSNYFNGSSSENIASSSGMQLNGSSNFTIEGWVYATAYAASPFFANMVANLNGTNGWYFGLFGTASTYSSLYFTGVTSSVVKTSIGCNYSFSLNTWYHIAVVNNGGTYALYVNGVSQTLAANTVAAWTDVTTPSVGGTQATSARYYFPGYLSNVRVVKGSSVYTGNFTPSTTPLTAITNTTLLTCQSNSFKDNSSTNAAITLNSTPSIQPFEPFVSTATPYDAAQEGGSIYCSGSASDGLTIPSSSNLEAGSGDFTIEGWIYPLAYPAVNTGAPIAKRPNSSGYDNFSVSLRNNGAIEAYFSLSSSASLPNIITAGTCPLNSWTHVAFVKSGLVRTLYVNGVQVGTVTSASNPPTGLSTTTRVGYSDATLNGYLSNVRILKGTALYTTTFTPPTAPLTAITNTQLLLSGTNAGIYDNAIKNNLITVGDAQVSTSVVKYGTGSLKFDGTGDYITATENLNTTFGTGKFTVEFWVYANSFSTTPGLVAKGTSGLSTNWQIAFSSGGVLQFFPNGTTATNGSTLSTGTWYHIAIVGEITTLKVYVNGTQDISVTQTYNYSDNSILRVGVNRGGTASFNGYIDDLRITKGVARYTANFTPPTAAFPNQ